MNAYERQVLSAIDLCQARCHNYPHTVEVPADFLSQMGQDTFTFGESVVKVVPHSHNYDTVVFRKLIRGKTASTSVQAHARLQEACRQVETQLTDTDVLIVEGQHDCGVHPDGTCYATRDMCLFGMVEILNRAIVNLLEEEQ